MTAEGLARRNALYIERLKDADFRDVKAAFDEALDSDDKFPSIARLKKLAEKHRERREALEALQRKQVEDHGQLSAHMRNEAVLLIEGLTLHVPDDLPNLQDQRNFWAEAANLWARVRPSGGLEILHKERRYSHVAHAMQAWARKRLDIERLHHAYMTPSTLEVYHALTGEEPELSYTATPPPGPLTRHLTAAA